MFLLEDKLKEAPEEVFKFMNFCPKTAKISVP